MHYKLSLHYNELYLGLSIDYIRPVDRLFKTGVHMCMSLISCTKCGFVKLIERIACSLSLLLMQLRTSVKMICNY